MPNLNIIRSYPTLILSVGFASVALFNDIPAWIFLVASLFWLWKLLISYLKLKSPSKYLTGFFSFVFLIFIYLEFKTLLGKDSATSFIVILASLKVLEFTDEVEKDFIVLLGFFLTTAKFLFSYDLIFLILSIPTYFLLTINLLPRDWLRKNIKEATLYLVKIFILALPISIVMFILFPRVTKTLTELNVGSLQGVSGFSDSISPGSISELSLNNEVAMRLELYNLQNLTLKNLYLKGLVLEKMVKNMNWTVSRSTLLSPSQVISEDADYKIVMEPTHKHFLFSLYNTQSLTSDSIRVFYDKNYLFKTDSIIEKRTSLKGLMGPLISTVDPTAISLNKETQNLDFSNEKLKAKLDHLINSIRNSAKNHHEINSQILDFFDKNNFQYSLTPGTQQNLSLEVFLFQSKKGYCEHYAAAHASLLRLSGVPSRVIVGYQGGEFNPIGKFWTFRQKDAHAWVEYLNENKQWILTDPISVIAPQRIELGGELFSSINNDLLTVQEIETRIKSKSLLVQLTMWFENLNYQWTTFLLDFDFEKQKELFQKYKLPLTFSFIVLILILTVFSISIQRLSKKKRLISYSQLAFEEINSWAEKNGLAKSDFEGPLQWQNRITATVANQQILAHLNSIFAKWIQISFSPLGLTKESEALYLKLKKEIKNLKVHYKNTQS